MAVEADNNSEFTIKKGETGRVMIFTLKSAGAGVNLTGRTVTLSTKDADGVIAINNAACVPDPDQTLNPGKCSFTFSAPNAAHDAGVYKLEFKTVSGSVVNYFPTEDEEPYGTLRVIDPLQ